MSPLSGGSALSNSASGTIGPSGCGLEVSGPVAPGVGFACGLGASGPAAAGEPLASVKLTVPPSVTEVAEGVITMSPACANAGVA